MAALMITTDTATAELTPAECWNLLRSTGLGRLATAVDGVAGIFPVNYLVHDEKILFRSAPGSKLVQITADPLVAFEVDGMDSRWHWSVVIHGTAKRLSDGTDVIGSGVLELVSWTPTKKYNYVRITPTDITGRRIDRRAFPRASLAG
jgi:hypothetical protein